MGVAPVLRFAPKVNHPISSLPSLNPGYKTFAAEFFDQRRWQKRRDDKQAFIRLENLHAFADLGQRFDTTTQQIAHVELFELIQRWHGN